MKGSGSMKRPVIRVGDSVRILKPLWVKRVGYPQIWTDLVDGVVTDPSVWRAYRILVGLSDDAVEEFADIPEKMPKEFVRAVAMMRVEQRGFGGDKRKILYWSDEENRKALRHGWEGRIEQVYGKRVAYTGVRVPEFFGVDSRGEHWHEPGGLEDKKAHVILDVGVGELEACHVELYTRNP